MVEQIRELEHSLQMRAGEGLRKIVIIAEADRLIAQAANAFLKTLEEPPKDSLLVLLSALPEVLPDTIRSRCIAIPLAGKESLDATKEERELIELLRETSRGKERGVQGAYRLTQGVQALLRKIREEIQAENESAQKRDETRYRNTTDGTWLDEREGYYKALTESLYLRRRARLLETFFLWWSDVLRASTGLAHRDLPVAKGETKSGRSSFQRLRFYVDCGDWKNCAITSAATFKKRWRSRWPFSEFSLVRFPSLDLRARLRPWPRRYDSRRTGARPSAHAGNDICARKYSRLATLSRRSKA